MYIIKNAFKSITRSKIRNILIGTIITIIVTSSAVALSIKNAANEIEQSYLDSYKITANISLDRSSLRKAASGSTTKQDPQSFMSGVQNISVEDVLNYADSEYVSSYLMSVQTSVDSSNITKVTSTSTNQTAGPGRGPEINNNSSGDFKLIGYNSLDSMTNFISSNYKITSGEMFDISDTANPCVISEELAEANSLTVGSTITLTNPNNSAETYTFTVKGIYSDTTESNEFSMFSNSANQILTNYTSLNNIVTTSNNTEDTKLNVQVSATYNLVNSDAIDKFTAEVKTKGLSEYYTVSTNLTSFEQSIAPIENLSSFANTSLIVVLSIGGLILVVLNMLNVRERKYEIGVLRAIGMKKSSVLYQFVIELLMVTFIAIVIGSTLGSVISVPIASNMLASEISAQTASNQTIESNFGRAPGTMGDRGGMFNAFSSNSNVDYIDQINAVVDVNILIQLGLIGILLTALSSGIAMIFISRYTPLKILSNRS